MSGHPKVYRFATPQQWQRCLLHRFGVIANGTLAPTRRLAAAPTRLGGERIVGNVAASPGGTLYARLGGPRTSAAPTAAPGGAPTARLIRRVALDREEGPFGIDGALAASPRWVIDREWIWAFTPATSIVHRYERDTLQHDLAVDLGAPIRDIATDGRGGVWLLLDAKDAGLHAGERAEAAEGEDGGGAEIVHVDCRGCRSKRHPVPCGGYAPRQIAVVHRGRHVVLLSGDGRKLLFIDPATGAIVRVLAIGTLASCWRAALLACDGKQRVALWGEQRIEGKRPVGIAFICDADGDVVDGPLPLESIGTVAALAVHKDALAFATASGLWRLSAGEASSARESDGVILTPALLSPDSNPTRGWLRAEICVTLPRGGVLEVEYATTNDESIARQAIQIAGDRSAMTRANQDAIWQLLEHPPARKFRFTSVSATRQPIAIPLFESHDRWCWLRLSLMTPPGNETGAISELRVLYPDLSNARHLPAAFFGERKDPTGAMRRLVGVLESTSQRIDEKIRGIGSYIDPRTAPAEWLDYLGRWLELPWDDQLSDDAKRRLLKNAGPLLEKRGTRDGLALLVRSLLGDRASARITDLTVDHTVAVLGGGDRPGVPLPLLLGGTVHSPTLGEKAVLGRVCLGRKEGPLDVIVPSVHITLTVSPSVRRQIEPLIEGILSQYAPAGVRVATVWRSPSAFGSAMSDCGDVVLDDVGPGRVSKESTLGRVRLGGRKNTVARTGLAVGFRLR